MAIGLFSGTPTLLRNLMRYHDCMAPSTCALSGPSGHPVGEGSPRTCVRWRIHRNNIKAKIIIDPFAINHLASAYTHSPQRITICRKMKGYPVCNASIIFHSNVDIISHASCFASEYGWHDLRSRSILGLRHPDGRPEEEGAKGRSWPAFLLGAPGRWSAIQAALRT